MKWDDGRGGTPSNPWGSSGASGNANGSPVAGEMEGDGDVGDGLGGGKKKGGKPKKQTLYRFG